MVRILLTMYWRHDRRVSFSSNNSSKSSLRGLKGRRGWSKGGIAQIGLRSGS